MSAFTARLTAFVQDECIPAEKVYEAEVKASGKRWGTIPAVLLRLQQRARCGIHSAPTSPVGPPPPVPTCQLCYPRTSMAPRVAGERELLSRDVVMLNLEAVKARLCGM